MLKLQQVIRIISKNSLTQTWRACSVRAELQRRSSELQKLYANHEHLLYSSYLESQVEPVSFRKKKWLQSKEQKQRNNLFKSKIQTEEEEFKGKPGSWTVHETEEPDSETTELKREYPKNWMEDYEFYEGAVAEEDNIDSTHGTADPTLAPSKVPCSGCGARLHCVNSSLPGYIPSEIFKGRTKKELQTIICQRCHFLKHYNIALDVEVTAEMYVKTISKIKDKFALAVVIVDLLDFPCSIWPGMQELLGHKRPVFIVGNKVDLLPRDSNRYLEHVKGCLHQQVLQSGFDALNVKYMSLISAKTGYGIEELITQLHKIWLYKGDVYLLGCTNVGKSSLFNILLNSDYCRPQATNLIRKATTCPWPGTTLQMLKFPILRPSDIRVYHRFRRLFSERAQKAAFKKMREDQARKTGSITAAQLADNVGRTFEQREDLTDGFSMSSGTQPIVTLNEHSPEYQQAKWCYDTPGVMHPQQITNLLTSEELLKLSLSQMISPRAFRLKPGMSVFLAGLARLDLINYTQTESDWIKILIFSAPQLPVVIAPTAKADEIYDEYLGTDILGIPCGSAERFTRWPGLQCKEEDLLVTGTNESGLTCDIVLSSTGWVGLSIPLGEKCALQAWTPNAHGIYMRAPSLIPRAERLIGKRIRNSLAYNLAKPFVFNNRTKG